MEGMLIGIVIGLLVALVIYKTEKDLEHWCEIDKFYTCAKKEWIKDEEGNDILRFTIELED